MKTIVGLHLSNDAAACLADNQIDLFTELRRELQRDGATVERSAWPADTRQRDQEKSPELVILVAGVTTVMVATAIARIIDSVSRYKAVIHDKPLVPASETEVKFGELHVSLKG